MERIDWTTASGLGTDPDGLLADLTISSSVQLQASGSGSLDIGGGSVVAGITDFSLNIATLDVVTGNAALGGTTTAGTTRRSSAALRPASRPRDPVSSA